jgi:hypothetical protein
MASWLDPDSPHPLQRLSPSQRALLQLICWVAWADGDFALAERELLERVVARLLLVDGPEPAAVEVVRALTLDRLQEADIDSLVAALDSADQRQLAAKLALQMVSICKGPEDQSLINSAEKQAYRRLIEALALPESELQEAEWAVRQELAHKRSLLEVLGSALERFGAWPAPEELDPRLPMGYWL